jgi:hypothetical protein
MDASSPSLSCCGWNGNCVCVWSERWPQLALVNVKEKEQEKSALARTRQRVRAWADAYTLGRRCTRSFLAMYREKIFFADMHASHRVKKARIIEVFFLLLSHIALEAIASFYVI